MAKVLIWGFYNQGNLGDDLMAAMFYELAEQAGHKPVLLSTNARFDAMGYVRCVTLVGLEVDHIIIGGGAFFKKGGPPNSAIERSIAELAEFIEEKRVPVIGASLGSDGIKHIREASPARRAVAQSQYFQGAAVRLRQDLTLGLPKLRYIPDIVLLTRHFCETFPRLKPVAPTGTTPNFLINLSRRSAWCLPYAIWLGRGYRKAFFRAHTGCGKTGGEISLPIFPTIEEISVNCSLGYLRCAEIIVSSKLHPGVIAMSFARRFIPVAPTKKTQCFLLEATEQHGSFTPNDYQIVIEKLDPEVRPL